jgi:tRNA(Ile)-lysidine synthase
MTMLSRAEIAALFEPVAGERVLLAVSGGPDSVALMRLAAEWRAGLEAKGAQLFVATVDHGLRSESRSEAEDVGRWAAAFGLPHQILTWSGAKPRTRVQERARAARYAVLCAHARTVGAGFLVTAHHADDQAETILFRLLRGSGLAGLAGMQSMTKLDDIALYRPLLNLPKKTLIAYCEALGQPFVRDPSNENPAFARTRLRALLPVLAEAGFDAGSLTRLGRRAARVEQALAAETARVSSQLEKTRLGDGVAIPLRSLRGLPEEILRRVIGAEIAALQPGKMLRFDRLESLAQDLYAAMLSGEVWHRTLGGVRLCANVDGLLTLRREKPRRASLAQARVSSKACDHLSNTATL